MGTAKKYVNHIGLAVASRRGGRVINLKKILLILCPIALVACGRMDISSNNYESYAIAQDAGAVGQGVWLPSELPESAVGIRETHDVDTNEVWFYYSSDARRPPGSCSKIPEGDLNLPRARRIKEVEVFFRGLKVVQESGGASFYRCQGEEYDYYLVIDPENDRAFGWVVGDRGSRVLP